MELERIVDKALVKDPGERYQSVSDLLVDLKAVRRRLGDSESQPTRPASAKVRRKPPAWALGAGALVVAIAGILAWQQFSGGGGASPPGNTEDGRVSIAVLPLDNMSADENQEYVADGMTEALIAELAQIHALRVTSRTSVMRFKETTQPIAEIAAALGVSTIIEGSVMQSGGRVRVTAQLIDAKTDEHLWAESYERDMSDVLALQSEVARAIAHEVKVELTPGESERLSSAKPVDPRAYDYYLRGRHHWNRRSKPDLERALELFEQVVEIQPDWALGYSALSETYLVMSSWGILPPTVAYPRAQEFANRALELDPDLGSAWACLGGVEAEWRWDWDKADASYRKAIELEPSNASAHQWYAEFLIVEGRFDESLESIDLAIQIDPLSLIVGATKARIYWYKGDFDRSIAESEQVLVRDPDFGAAKIALANACQLAGQHDRAADMYARFYGASIPGAEENLRAAFDQGGMDAVVRVLINGSKQASRTQYVSPARIAFLFASIGEADSAMVWFERAYETRAFPVQLLTASPYSEPIRDDPRFVDLAKRMGLQGVNAAYLRE